METAREYATLFAAMSRASFLIPLIALLAAGCSSLSKKQPVVVPAGEKATVGPLIYSVIDTEVLPQLGDDPNTARRPQNRFYLVTVSVSNSSTEDLPIPALTLVDDSGKEFNEVVDGTNVSNWLGVIRRVGAAQTEQGTILFDAPAEHYRLRLTDDADENQLSIDVPLNFVHEQLKAPPPDAVAQPNK